MHTIRNIELSDLDALLAFTNKWIGDGYFNKEELRALLLQGVHEDLNASFIAEYEGKIIAARITLIPYQWTKFDHIAPYISTHMYNVPYKKAAYFQSLFVDHQFQGKGIGSELTKRSLEVLYQMGCMAVVCHSWVESPNNSSQKYLLKFGFEPVSVHKNFWMFKDYKCPRCKPQVCQCSAEEMIYYFPLEEE
ncbi:MAG: hypothetical protein CME62_05845 [Halobacteriovoraceae bacterium]|nr:hypothetical protein [Halobacteriovoraceae bacterium]|tara:strand:- start:32779 stop:33354 length:576 start_codon:yes stop_codon:yes gene_type:complete